MPSRFGSSAAVVAGDLAAVLADRLLSRSGFDAEPGRGRLEPYPRDAVDMALGQYLTSRAWRTDPTMRDAWRG